VAEHPPANPKDAANSLSKFSRDESHDSGKGAARSLSPASHSERFRLPRVDDHCPVNPEGTAKGLSKSSHGKSHDGGKRRVRSGSPARNLRNSRASSGRARADGKTLVLVGAPPPVQQSGEARSRRLGVLMPDDRVIRKDTDEGPRLGASPLFLKPGQVKARPLDVQRPKIQIAREGTDEGFRCEVAIGRIVSVGLSDRKKRDQWEAQGDNGFEAIETVPISGFLGACLPELVDQAALSEVIKCREQVEDNSTSCPTSSNSSGSSFFSLEGGGKALEESGSPKRKFKL
jgi:hypothetical protein